jgi:hypothetical protein
MHGNLLPHTVLSHSWNWWCIMVDANATLMTIMCFTDVVAVCSFSNQFVSSALCRHSSKCRRVFLWHLQHVWQNSAVPLLRAFGVLGRVTVFAHTIHTIPYLPIYLQPSSLLIRERRCPPSCKQLTKDGEKTTIALSGSIVWLARAIEMQKFSWLGRILTIIY